MYVKPNDPLDRYQVRAMLPRVGDRLKMKPEFGKTPGSTEIAKPLPCVVTYVHRAHLWYQVEFQSPQGPFRECHKLPAVAAGVL